MYRTRITFALGLCIFIATLGSPQLARADDGSAVDIAATNAIVVDVASGQILFEKAAGERVAPASLTKLITAAVIAESVPFDTEITITDADIIGEASMALQPGETLSVDALLRGMLMASGNDAASAVARGSMALTDDSSWQATQRFLDRANARVTQLGMYDTHLVNSHGLDEEGHISSARDLAAIGVHVSRTLPELLDMAGNADWTGEGHSLRNTNDLLGSYPGLVAGKTGYTESAGYCLVEIARRDGRMIVVVLLGSTADARWTDAIRLLDFGFSTLPAAAAEAGYGAITGERAAARGTSANLTSATDVEAVVRPSSPARDLPWRVLVVACVGVAGLTLSTGLWKMAPPRRPRSQIMSVTATRDGSVVSSHSESWETQPFAHPFARDVPASLATGARAQSGWTAALPDWQFSNLD